MKFTLSINMERTSPAVDMRDVARHTLEMAQMAEVGGFDIVWVGEHYTIEPTISPAPFQLLAHLAAHTSTVRLGTACVVAPYWHPIKLAGEAAMFDLLSGGRLELGIGRGAYQWEFDRLAGGIPQQRGVAYMKELLPALKGLWQGDYEHKGEYWSFPTATSVPKPLQKPHPRESGSRRAILAPMIGPSPMDAASIPGRSPDLSRNSRPISAASKTPSGKALAPNVPTS